MSKYQVVYEQAGGWCVIVSSKYGEDRYYGFRDKDHARDWIANKLETKHLVGQLGILAM
jgi:hypothetical protein